jgi:hypothetical protein
MASASSRPMRWDTALITGATAKASMALFSIRLSSFSSVWFFIVISLEKTKASYFASPDGLDINFSLLLM